MSLPTAFAGMARHDQFVIWRAVAGMKPGKMDKVPLDCREFDKCDPHDPAHQYSYFDAYAAAQKAPFPVGIGFVFTENDPYFFVDIDNAIMPGADKFDASKTFWDVYNTFPGAGFEISHSKTGAHLFGRTMTVPPHAKKNRDLGVELYTSRRFVALTFDRMQGDCNLDFTAQLCNFAARYFPPKNTSGPDDWSTEPVPQWAGYEDDDDLIERALQTASAEGAFGKRATFEQLWRADWDALRKFYPGDGEEGADRSLVDAALAQHLAFWTGNDCERMLRLMQRSSLVRTKWDREDYMQATILQACAKMDPEKVYSAHKGKGSPADRPTVTQAVPREAATSIMMPQLQPEYFKGCVYVRAQNRIWAGPYAELLGKDQFDATYGGFRFMTNRDNQGNGTKSAWVAFTQSEAWEFPAVHNTAFRPDRPESEIFEEDGRSFVNTFRPCFGPAKNGDPSPFLNHLAKILPAERDREILLSYMAAMRQNPGVKMQWAPLIQGAHGNGKSIIGSVLEYCVGAPYTHTPRASDLGNKFNAWMFGNLLAIIEEVYVPEHRRDVMDTLKVWITQKRQERQGKSADQITQQTCINFMMFTNHYDAIVKTRNDRRYAIFYTAQQTVDDIIRDGMHESTGTYFADLWTWLRDGGFAIMADYLQTYQIPKGLNPATDCFWAPETTAHAAAIAATRGGVEQEILEAVKQGRYGFAGGWISSIQLDNLLRELGADRKIPRSKRPLMLQSLDYVPHPGLPDGRATAKIPQDGGKRPNLYVVKGHASVGFANPKQIMEMYLAAQTASETDEAFGRFVINGGASSAGNS